MTYNLNNLKTYFKLQIVNVRLSKKMDYEIDDVEIEIWLTLIQV